MAKFFIIIVTIFSVVIFTSSGVYAQQFPIGFPGPGFPGSDTAPSDEGSTGAGTGTGTGTGGGGGTLKIPGVLNQNPGEDITPREAAGSLLDNVADLLAIIGVGILIIAIIWGAIRYMTAGGSQERATAAREVLLNGVIGGAILVLISIIIGLIFNVGTLFD